MTPGQGGASGDSRPSLRKAAEVFQSRNYRFLWASSSFSFTGMQMQQITRALLTWELTHSFGAIGAVSLSFGLPMLLFSLIGGSLADRFEKRNLSLMTQAASGGLAFLTAMLVLTDTITFEWLIAVGLVQGTFFAFGLPARTPLMVEAVGPEKVMSAIAMSQASMNATRLVGPGLAGAIVGVWGIDVAYFAQSGLYAISIVTLLMVPTGIGAATRQRAAATRGNMLVEIGRGLQYVASDPRLRLLVGMMFIMTFFAMPYIILLAGFVQEDLGQSQAAFGWLQSISGAGALAGSLGVATLTEFDRKPLVQWIAGILGGAGLILLSVGSASFGYPGAIVAVMIMGLAFTAYQTLNNTMVMSHALPEYYGRVQSINMLTFSSMPLMAYPLGAIADRIGAMETFIAQGAIVLGFMVVIAVFNSRYTFRRTSELEAGARERAS
jgi:MFS family permease